MLHLKPNFAGINYKRYWIWLKRFRHRKGYGVHSPFAFDFITRVIYGKVTPEERRKLQTDVNFCKESKKVRELVFRLKKESAFFKYVNYPHNPLYIYKVYDEVADSMSPKGIFAIKGIYKNNEMKETWQRLVNDERSGITFDLYDVGIILFDKKITKQDYIVNF